MYPCGKMSASSSVQLAVRMMSTDRQLMFIMIYVVVVATML